MAVLRSTADILCQQRSILSSCVLRKDQYPALHPAPNAITERSSSLLDVYFILGPPRCQRIARHALCMWLADALAVSIRAMHQLGRIHSRGWDH